MSAATQAVPAILWISKRDWHSRLGMVGRARIERIARPTWPEEGEARAEFSVADRGNATDAAIRHVCSQFGVRVFERF